MSPTTSITEDSGNSLTGHSGPHPGFRPNPSFADVFLRVRNPARAVRLDHTPARPPKLLSLALFS